MTSTPLPLLVPLSANPVVMDKASAVRTSTPVASRRFISSLSFVTNRRRGSPIRLEGSPSRLLPRTRLKRRLAGDLGTVYRTEYGNGTDVPALVEPRSTADQLGSRPDPELDVCAGDMAFDRALTDVQLVADLSSGVCTCCQASDLQLTAG